MKGKQGRGGGGFLAALVNKTATRIVMNLKMVGPREAEWFRGKGGNCQKERGKEGGRERWREKERERERWKAILTHTQSEKQTEERKSHPDESRICRWMVQIFWVLFSYHLSSVNLYHNFRSWFSVAWNLQAGLFAVTPIKQIWNELKWKNRCMKKKTTTTEHGRTPPPPPPSSPADIRRPDFKASFSRIHLPASALRSP